MEEIKIVAQNEIKYDFSNAKKEISEQLELYRGLVFTEDAKKQAKDTVADLRKRKKELQDKVKEVKQAWMKPFEEFANAANEVITLYDEPIGLINQQVTEFENKRIEEKREHIRELYQEVIPEADLQAVTRLDLIYDEKWLNATATDKSIREAMLNAKEMSKTAISMILSFNTEKQAEAIEMYGKTRDVQKVIAYINQYETQKREFAQREAERIRREEEERIRREERMKIEAEQKIEQAREEVIEALTPSDNGAMEEILQYTIFLTPDARRKLEMYMDSVGITYHVS